MSKALKNLRNKLEYLKSEFTQLKKSTIEKELGITTTFQKLTLN